MFEFKIEITFEKVRDCEVDSVPPTGFYWHCPDSEDIEEGFYLIEKRDYAIDAATGMAVAYEHLRDITGTMYKAHQKLFSVKLIK